MTVADLMNILKDMPPDVKVYAPYMDGGDPEELREVTLEPAYSWMRGEKQYVWIRNY
jgi:hypothetical protein